MLIKNAVLSISLFFSLTSMSLAGFGLEATRVIFYEGSFSASVVAFNTDKETNFLVQSWIENSDDIMTMDFVATPPIFKLKAEHKNTIQITKNANLSENQESLYWLNVKFVAPSSKSNENILRYSMSNKIKLIYRPITLKSIDMQKEVENIKWKYSKDNLIIDNNSPIYINIADLKIDKKEINAPSFISPYSKVKIASKIVHPNSTISLRYINDYGTPILQEYKIKN